METVMEKPKNKVKASVEKVTPEEVTEETKSKKKEVVTKESEALGKLRADFITSQRKGAEAYLKLVESELEKVEQGHPHYADLKFAKIRADRIIFSLDEMSRGKGQRS